MACSDGYIERPRIWKPEIEMGLCEIVADAQPLWIVREGSDIGDHEYNEFERTKEHVNQRFKTGFTTEQVITKWLEIRLLFDLKFAMNGYTMEDRGHHIRRDGSLKDDLNESWVLFKTLGYLADPDAGKRRPPKMQMHFFGNFN